MARDDGPHRIYFSIGVAAERTGMHPQTLREYERKGLIRPHRTPGGARRYRDQELHRLRRIQQLTEMGLSLTGVEYVMRMEDRIADLEAEVRQLRERLARHEPGERQSQRDGHGEAVGPLSMSLEIVHVPRARRGPRWRNQ